MAEGFGSYLYSVKVDKPQLLYCSSTLFIDFEESGYQPK
jgi:hypothetical protein